MKINNFCIFYDLCCCPRANGECINKIILHHTWTNTQKSTIHALNSRNASTHYLIERNGDIINLLNEGKRAYHCVGNNFGSIGIDLQRGPKQEITFEQYVSLSELVKDICTRYKLEKPVLHKKTLYFHRDLSATKCPGDIDENLLNRLIEKVFSND